MYDPALARTPTSTTSTRPSAGDDVARFEEECRLADAAAAVRRSTTPSRTRGEAYSLRFVYVHMIAEYARHNGHADLIRQSLDGVTAR